MDEQLTALLGNTDSGNSASESDSNVSDMYERLTRLEQKLDKILSLVDKDVSIDETNDDKISIAEAEGKIDEKEEDRESGEDQKGE